MRRTHSVDLSKYLDQPSQKTDEEVKQVEPPQHEPIIRSIQTIRPAWPREVKPKQKGKI